MLGEKNSVTFAAVVAATAVAAMTGFGGTFQGRATSAPQTAPAIFSQITDAEAQNIAGVACRVRVGPQPGPTVLVVIAGDAPLSPTPPEATVIRAEAAGGKTLTQIATWRLLRGKIIFVSPPSADGDAVAARAFLDAARPDWVVELRDGRTAKTPAFRVFAPPSSPSHTTEARRLRKAVSASESKTTPLGALARLAAAQTGGGEPLPVVQAVAAGLGAHPSLSVRTRFLRRAAALLLADLEMVAPGSENALTPPSVPASVVRVAMYDSDGAAGKGPVAIEGVLDDKPGFCFRRVCATDIQKGALSGFDVLINPGGSSSKQGRNLSESGRAAVKSFIENGGGYVGICAGAYLATGSYKWSLGLLSADVADRKNSHRGRATLTMMLTPKGRAVFGDLPGPLLVTYHNGPVLEPVAGRTDSHFEPLAVFQNEITRKGGKKGVMVGSAAIAADRYGKGRIIGISPHPEQTPGLTEIVPRAVRYVAGRQ